MQGAHRVILLAYALKSGKSSRKKRKKKKRKAYCNFLCTTMKKKYTAFPARNYNQKTTFSWYFLVDIDIKRRCCRIRDSLKIRNSSNHNRV